MTSEDPNSTTGPAGYDTPNFVSPANAFPYRIDFENAATATAPAQRVDITDQLDPNLDWSTFQWTSFGFGDNVISIPANTQHYETTLPMTYDGVTFRVVIDLDLDPLTGILHAMFQSLNAATLMTGLATCPGTLSLGSANPDAELPPPVTIGFLPPEDGTGRGMGFLTYTISPKAGLPTGTQIRNVADVTFDLGTTIATDQVSETDPTLGVDPSKQALVTIDSVAPTSSVAALPAFSSVSAFPVSWSGTDDAGGSGLASYTIYVSDDGGPFTPWLTDTTLTSATYDGQDGHTYGFYSIATDNVGNVESAPSGAQASTTVQFPASQFVLTPASSSVQASAPDNITLVVEDVNGISETGYVGTVTLSASDSTAQFTDAATGLALAGNSYTFTSADAGSHTFTVTDTQSGSLVVTATDASDDLTTTAGVTILDVTPPTSSVAVLPTFSFPTFTLNWSGSDNPGGSGLASYSVFVSDNGGAFTPLLTDTTQTSTTFNGLDGHTYGFYSIATDNAGNVQPTPTSAQASTIIEAAPSSTAAANATVIFSTLGQNVTLNATITSPAGVVNEGTETFTLLNGTTIIGSPVTVNVSAGTASAVYELPGGTPVNTYTIQAVYNGTNNFSGTTDASHTLTISPASVSAVSVGWGTQTALLQTASDGVRLLPSGRSTDLPWDNINTIPITLNQPAVLNPGDVSVTGIAGGNYGPITLSGSGTSYVITLAKSISAADRVTLTIGNAEIATFTGRLDVLPGDVNDDGAVNTTDGVLILDNKTPTHTYNVFYDMNGDDSVTTSDFTLYRPFIGTTLPALPKQFAAGGEGPGGVARLTLGEVAPVLTAAIQQWAAAGLPIQDVTLLQHVSVQITNLPTGYLGTTAISGSIVYLSADAAGYGWSVDTPTSMSPAADQEDLLTVLMHEMGHTLGLSDLNPTTSSNDLMATTLATGVRRLPSAQDLAAVLAEQGATGQTVLLPTGPTNTAALDAVFADTEWRFALSPAGSMLTRIAPTLAGLDALSGVVPPLYSLPAPITTVPGTDQVASLDSLFRFVSEDKGAKPKVETDASAEKDV